MKLGSVKRDTREIISVRIKLLKNRERKIGWVKSSQISDKILKNLKITKVGNHTKPIKLNNSYIILKINNKKLIEKKVDFNKEFEKLVIIEKNKQLNQFSNIYFKKIKQNTFISEI